MFNVSEYRKKPELLADRLPWALMAGAGTVLGKDGHFQKTYSYRGPDLASSTKDELVAVVARVNNALMRLGEGYTLWVEARRELQSSYPRASWPDPISLVVDEERRRRFERGTFYDTEYYLTLVWQPPRPRQERLLTKLFKREGGGPAMKQERRHPIHEQLARFEAVVGEVAGILSGVFPAFRALDDDETLTYLHGCVSTRRHPVQMPEVPMYLDALLADEVLEAGTRVKLGDRALEVLTIRGYPGSTLPGILEGLNQLAFPYRATTRFICLSKEQARSELERYQRGWFAQREGLLSLVSQLMGMGASQLANQDALNKAGEVGMGLEVLQNDSVAFGYLTQVVVVEGATRQEAEERIAQVAKTIQSRGFATVIEGLHSKDAWLSTHPGNVWAHVRRPLMHSLNVAHMLPLSAVWAGSPTQTHLKAAPHLWTQTTGNTPFRLSTNVGDVGHTLVLGPTGAGKSVLLNLLGLQWLKYPGSRVVVFDKGASSLAACLGVAGTFHDPGKQPLKLQPLGRVDEESERGVAAQWLEQIARREGVVVDPALRIRIWEALEQLAGIPRELRTMSSFCKYVQSRALREGLQRYVQGGSFGALFDGDSEELALSRWVSFEMEALMQDHQGAVPAYLSYLFHRLEQLFDGGKPTLLILDEAWTFLDDPQFAERIRSWLKVLRKKRVYVVFASQSLADAMESPLAPTLLEACQTRLLLPNAQASAPQVRAYYEHLGLNARQIQLISQATPKQHYYYQSKLGDRLFELGLGPVQLAFCAASSPDDLATLRTIARNHPPEARGQAWLEACGLNEARLLVQRVTESANQKKKV
jgi:type IV secretion system protein VirB4